MHTHHRPIRSYVLRQGRLTPAQKNALDQLWSSYGIDYTEKILDLKSVFGRTAPVTLEIGFGNGDSLIAQAIKNPQQNYLGIEVHRPGVGHCINRAHLESLKNLRVMCHDAIEILSHQIAANSLDCVQLFFPDPWHKKRHHKRRILQPAFIECVQQRLKKGGRFHMATDWEEYAQHMLKMMAAQSGFNNLAGKGNYAADNAERPQTKFERRGERLGHAVFDLIFTRT